jgi:DNA-binding protein HU-beta
MTKEKLIEQIADRLNGTKKSAAQAVDAMLESMQEALTKGDEVRLTGFGSFQVTERQQRRGRNPQTGEEITIPANKAVKFKPGKDLKERVK